MVYRIFPAFLKTFITSSFLIGLVPAAYGTAKALALPLGYLSDRIGHQKAVTLAFGALILTTLGLSFANGIVWYILFFFIVGLISNFFYSSISALVGRSAKATQSFFRMESAYQLGLFLGPIIGGIIAFQYSMTLAIQVWVLLAVIGFVASSRFLRYPVERRTSSLKLLEVLRNRPRKILAPLLSSGFVTGFLLAGMDLAIPLYAVSLGYNLVEVGSLLGFAALINVAGSYTLSARIQRRSYRTGILIAFFFCGLSFFSLLFVTDLVLLIIAAGLFSIGRTSALNVGRGLLVTTVTERNRATTLSLLESTESVGRIAGPLLIGLLIDATTFAAVFQLLLGIVIVATIGVVVFGKTISSAAR
ncbi:MAG: MFS transporter [Nanoarchaeota archaeon]|nr:MFS transporter [Nanoarchaeota archaeon]